MKNTTGKIVYLNDYRTEGDPDQEKHFNTDHQRFSTSYKLTKRIKSIRTIMASWIALNAVLFGLVFVLIPQILFLMILFIGLLNLLAYQIPLFKDKKLLLVKKEVLEKTTVIYSSSYEYDNEMYNNEHTVRRTVPFLYDIDGHLIVVSKKVYSKAETGKFVNLKRNVFGVAISYKETSFYNH